MGVSTAEVSFEYPRVSSGGSFVVTAVSPIRRGQSDTGLLYGVLNMNVLATTLSASINEFQILQTGYVYLVDAKNVSRIVIHPSATATCTSVRCCEAEFSSEEFEIFFADVLLPLQRQSPEEGAKSMNISTFRKGGEAWRFAHSMVTYGTVDYILFAVVPRSEIIKSSTDVEEQVSDSNTGILAAACCVLLVFTCVIFYIIGLLVEGIAQPVIELSRLCDQVIEGTLTGNAIPTKASSSDVRMLLTAFTNTMTALRFGSDSYAKGDVNLARELFEEALLLYTSTHQEKGIGACHNNLGAVYSSLGQYSEALVHYSKAIQQAEKALSEVSPEEEAAAAQQGGAVATAAPAVAIPTAALSPPSARATATSSPQHQYTQVATVATSSVATAPASTVTTNAASTQGVATAADKLKARRRAQRVLSDRRGNLALLHIAQEQYAEAFTCLESCMEQDKKWGYIRGCVVKQGNMGHLYLKQGMYAD